MKRAFVTPLVAMTAFILLGQAQTDWTRYNSPEGHYSILFPGESKLSSHDATTQAGKDAAIHGDQY